MMVDLDFADVADVLAPRREFPGKIGFVNRVTVKYADVQPMLARLAEQNLDGNLRVFRAGTEIRIMPPYHPEDIS